MNSNYPKNNEEEEADWLTESSDEDSETIPSNDEEDDDDVDNEGGEDEDEDDEDEDEDDEDEDEDEEANSDDSDGDGLFQFHNPFPLGLLGLNNTWNGNFFMNGLDHEDDPGLNVEVLTSSKRANIRPDTEEDLMSEFSGDEKYEIDRATYDEPGNGDHDMVDISPHESRFMNNSDSHLTYKIRQLMLRLSKGRKDRENKLHINSESTFRSDALNLHRLIVRGPDHPQELEDSPAVSFHFQCANYLCVTPSAMGLSDDIFITNHSSITRCGYSDIRKQSQFKTTKNEASGPSIASHVHDAHARKLNTVKATKFVKLSSKPESHSREQDYVPLDDDGSPICFAHKYGYFVMGTDSARLTVYCTQCDGTPRIVYDDRISSNRNLMLNSIQIVRWPRYDRSKFTREDSMDMDDLESEEDDDEDGYPSESGAFDYYLVMTGNEKGLFIAALPDHPKGSKKQHLHRHKYKFDEDHTWIRNGFKRAKLNDARVSPDGQWIAVVGDAPEVWTIEVKHVVGLGTESEESIKKKKSGDSSDSDYTTEDSEFGSDDEDTDNRERSNRKTYNHARRLFHTYGEPVAMTIPNEVLQGTRLKRNRRRVNERERYSSQYMSWNSTSTKFAHTSDISSRVVVWSMPSREIACCVDVGGPSYSISFHPTLENLFSVCNWYGFVHVVDITGSCMGDEDLIHDKDQLLSRTENGAKTHTCTGPHFEEKHDILMLSFRGEKNRRLRILDCIRGMGWSTDGRYLYVATLRRVLRYELKDNNIRIPSLFQQCARKVREWKEGEINRVFTKESKEAISEQYLPIEKDWKYVPTPVKRKIWGENFMMRSHNG